MKILDMIRSVIIYYSYVPRFVYHKIKGTNWVRPLTYEWYRWHAAGVDSCVQCLDRMTSKQSYKPLEEHSLFAGYLEPRNMREYDESLEKFVEASRNKETQKNEDFPGDFGC